MLCISDPRLLIAAVAAPSRAELCEVETTYLKCRGHRSIPDLQQAKVVQLPCLHYRISVLFDDSFSFPVSATHLRESEEEKLVDVHQFLGPKLVLVEDIGSEQLGRDTASQIF